MTIALICLAILTVSAMVWSRRRRTEKGPAPSKAAEVKRTAVPASSSRHYAIVDREKVYVGPYPYIYIEEDGRARELHATEREYLETPFQFGDGGRPYTKSSYEQKNGWGKTNGFLERSKVPDQVHIEPAPMNAPTTHMTKGDISRVMRERGFDVTEGASGSIIAKRQKPGIKPTD